MQFVGTHEGGPKEVASAHPGSPSLADVGQPGGWTRRFQPKRPVWTMPVVVLDIDPEDQFQVTRPTISSQSRHSARMVRIHRSA
jgi:hypothetical protein